MSGQAFSPRTIPSLPEDNPEFDADARRAEAAEAIRLALDVDDVLAELDYLLSDLRGAGHPLYALAAYCVRHGTTKETGKAPWMAENVGAALEPYIGRAIERLVARALREALAMDSVQGGDAAPPDVNTETF
jgi:hypothetical protein